MKTIMLTLMCLFVTLSGVAGDKSSSLVIKGDFIAANNVKYNICLINEDGSCTSVKQDDAYKFVKVNLELGREYKITFSSGSYSKVLFVKADAPGIFPVDIDFHSKDSALLSYNYNKRKYQLNIVDANEYAENYKR